MNIQHPASRHGESPAATSIEPPGPRIAVIGGGISGLAAANRLTELLPRADVTVFEESSRLGGVIDTVHRDGFLVERSADSFITKTSSAFDLCRRVGLAHQLLPTDESRRRAMVVRDGRLFAVPDGFFVMSPRNLWPMLTTPILSWRGKLRLLAEPLVPPQQLLEVEDAVGRFADESVASFVCRRFGREVFERLVQPLMSGIYTADPSKLSMAATMPQFLAYERGHGSLLRATLSNSHGGWTPPSNNARMKTGSIHSSDDSGVAASGARYGLFVAPEKGMTSLVNALEDRLPAGALKLNTRVTKVELYGDEDWHLNIGTEPESVRYDGIIIALPAFAASDLIKDCAAALSNELASIPYAGCAVVSVALRASQVRRAIDSFGFVVPRAEGRRIIAASFASAKFAGRAPSDAVLIRVFVGGALQPELVDLPDEGLKRLVTEELNDLLELEGAPLWFDIARWPRSMPQYHVGHLARVARIERLVAQLPRLALAGNAYHGVGIPQCIRSGETAAERLASLLGPR